MAKPNLSPEQMLKILGKLIALREKEDSNEVFLQKPKHVIRNIADYCINDVYAMRKKDNNPGSYDTNTLEFIMDIVGDTLKMALTELVTLVVTIRESAADQKEITRLEALLGALEELSPAHKQALSKAFSEGDKMHPPALSHQTRGVDPAIAKSIGSSAVPVA